MAGGTEPTVTPRSLVKSRDLDPLHFWSRHDCKLCDPIPTIKRDSLVSMVDEQDADLTPIPGVDQPRTVDNSYAMTFGMSTPGKDQPCEIRWYRDRNPRWHCITFAGLECHRNSGVKIYSRVADMSGDGNRKVGIESGEGDLHGKVICTVSWDFGRDDQTIVSEPAR